VYDRAADEHHVTKFAWLGGAPGFEVRQVLLCRKKLSFWNTAGV
jgi:hypothetical protein